MEAALAGLEPALVAALCHLGVPDRLTQPVPVAELAGSLDVDAQRLERLLRFAHVRGFVRLDRRGRVRPTRLTGFLRTDHPGGWSAWPTFAASAAVNAALGELSDGLVEGRDAFTTAHGQPFFSWLAENPDQRAGFDAAMAAGARMHGLLLARVLDLQDRERVCDIGGGDGTLLETLIADHPHLEGVVLELPEVATRMPARHRVVARPGDAFTGVPPGFDTYLLVNVLHDWDDEAAIGILSRAADAARAFPGGTPPAQIVVVDGRARPRAIDDLTLLADMLMLALTPGGHERTLGAFTDLGRRAGLYLCDHHPLASGDVALVFTVAGVD